MGKKAIKVHKQFNVRIYQNDQGNFYFVPETGFMLRLAPAKAGMHEWVDASDRDCEKLARQLARGVLGTPRRK